MTILKLYVWKYNETENLSFTIVDLKHIKISRIFLYILDIVNDHNKISRTFLYILDVVIDHNKILKIYFIAIWLSVWRKFYFQDLIVLFLI